MGEQPDTDMNKYQKSTGKRSQRRESAIRGLNEEETKRANISTVPFTKDVPPAGTANQSKLAPMTQTSAMRVDVSKYTNSTLIHH